jgi:hypothetical protein
VSFLLHALADACRSGVANATIDDLSRMYDFLLFFSLLILTAWCQICQPAVRCRGASWQLRSHGPSAGSLGYSIACFYELIHMVPSLCLTLPPPAGLPIYYCHRIGSAAALSLFLASAVWFIHKYTGSECTLSVSGRDRACHPRAAASQRPPAISWVRCHVLRGR